MTDGVMGFILDKYDSIKIVEDGVDNYYAHTSGIKKKWQI